MEGNSNLKCVQKVELREKKEPLIVTALSWKTFKKFCALYPKS